LQKNIYLVMLAHFVRWRKRYLQCSHRTKITNRTQLQQPRRKTSRQNSCACNRRSDSHWWHQSASHNSQVVKKTQVWYLSFTESRLSRAAVVSS